MYEVVFYEDKNGNSEIGDYFEKISQSKQKGGLQNEVSHPVGGK